MARKLILVVDDEKDIRDLLKLGLNRMGHDTLLAEDIETARGLINQTDRFDLCLTDIKLPDGSGIDLVTDFKSQHPDTPIAVMTAFDTSEYAVEAMKAGAFDFIAKPIRLERLRMSVESALNPLPKPEQSKYGVAQLIGDSGAMQTLKDSIVKAAKTLAPILICGESGTGKELVARAIHQESSRSSGPFVPVNCGAIPSELMESEFFGHKKGSFTGAVSDKVGLFQAAENGTLFLDEIGDLPLNMQVKLLRAIQEKSIRVVGSENEISCNVRLVSASHKSLDSEVAEGRFRQDLFYRLNVIQLNIPALRDRLADLPMLCQHLLARLDSSQNARLSEKALRQLEAHDFPGNVRELENILHRGLAMSDHSEIRTLSIENQPRLSTASDLEYGSLTPLDDYSNVTDIEGYLANIEHKILEQVIELENGDRRAVEKRLGLNPRQLRYKLAKYQLQL